MKKLCLLLSMWLIIAVGYSQTKVVDTAEYKAGEVLVKFKTEANENWLKKFNVHIKKLIYTKNMKAFKQKGFYVMAVDDVANAVKNMKKDSEVEWVEPNFKVQHQGFSSDPLYGDLWGINNIKAPTAWASGNKGKQEILVGIVDEDIMLHHEDLCGQVWVNPYDTLDGIDNDGNGYVDDINGYDFKNKDNTIFDGGRFKHGTHVFGSIGAIGDNNKGIIGVAPSVKAISAKFLEGSGYISDAVLAIDYITDLKLRHGLNIVATNNSWGGGLSMAVYYAIDRARQADILFIAAAGNQTGNDNDLNPFYPASFDLDNIISVAAIDVNDQLASFSCYGKTTVDIGAPGVGVLSTIPSSPAVGTYAFYNGTSMATPHVTGAAVLYKALHPTANYSQIKAAILSAARPIPALANITVTGGTLDVSSFTGNVTPPYINTGCIVPVLDLTPPTTPTNLRSLGIVSPTDYKVKWDLSTDSSGIDMYYLTSRDSAGVTLMNYILNGEDNISLGEGQVWSLTYGKTYQFSIMAMDTWGNWSGVSNSITINTNPDMNNQPEPTWYSYTLRYDSLNNTGRICFNDGGTPTVYYSQSSKLTQNSYLGYTKSLSNPVKKGYYSDGRYFYYIPRTVDREVGIISWMDSCYNGNPIDSIPTNNQPPTVSAGNDVIVSYGTVVTLLANGQDPENQTLNYNWRLIAGPYIQIPNPNNPSITLSGLAAATYIFRVTVTDPAGAQGYDDVKVTVLEVNNSTITLIGTLLTTTSHKLDWSYTGWTPTQFILEYTKSTTFATLATLPASTLTYTNKVKGNGTAYYRVTAKYVDNSVKQSNVVSLKIGGKTTKAGNSILMTNYPVGSYYTISTIGGTAKISGSIKSNEHIQDISNLTSGIYVVTILYADGGTDAIKFVK